MVEFRLIAAGVLVSLGTFFFLTGTIGVLRMPDVYTRLHAAAKGDSLGTGLWLLGLALLSGSTTVAIKLILLTVFVWVTSPTAAHCMARAAYRTGIRPDPRTGRLSDQRRDQAASSGG